MHGHFYDKLPKIVILKAKVHRITIGIEGLRYCISHAFDLKCKWKIKISNSIEKEVLFMTGKERILLAMTNQQPDRVPVVPDISNMVPARLTKKPFWDVFYHQNPPIGYALMDAADYYDMDLTYVATPMSFHRAEPPQVTETAHKKDGRLIVEQCFHTKCGDITQETTYYVDNCPTYTKKLVEDPYEDIEKFKALYSPILSYDREPLDHARARLGSRGAFGLNVDITGLQTWFNYFHGGLEELSALLYDDRDILEDLKEFWDRDVLRQVEMILDYQPDFLYFQSSGGLTLQSPQIFRDFSLDVVKKATAMAKQAGIPTLLHSCGKEHYLVELLSQETDLSCINPLEVPPMGDCDLAEIKKSYGDKIALMGNIQTTDVLLFGSTDDVRKACMKAIDDAAQGGGFILSSGDQPGRDTPDENLFAMVEVAKTYGKY